MAGASRQQEHEAHGHIASVLGEVERGKAGPQFAFSFVFNPKPKSVG